MSGVPTNPSPVPQGLRTTPHLLQRFCHRIGYLARNDRRETGFTLLEVVVSFVLFAIVAGAAVTGIVSSLKASHTSQQRVDAANVAQTYVSLEDTKSVQNGTSSFTAVVKNEQFSVQRTIAFEGSATTCAPGASFAVHVLVSQQTSGAFLARTDSVIACATS
jgi:type II secretory pathway component PulJ